MKKNILLIGVGGTGSNAVDTFFKKFHELGNQTDNKVTALVFDTDAGDLKKITAAKTVVMSDTASVGTICDRIGKQYLQEWFPCDAKDVRAQEMVRGASQWRKKSYLAFLNLMNKPAARSTFISALEDMVQDPGASCEVYVIASVAGGTGSGSFIPIALYAKRYLRKNLGKDPIVNAMIALPDIYADSQTPENRIKVYSNAYAILRELNAINLVARNYNAGLAAKKKAPVRFRIGHPDEPNVGVLFDASDKRFWTPEAAPFSQVFLLDRIPGLNSIAAHDMVLANSLYTILCTEIGSAFDSEFSNHELVRSQNNGSNAIYAGISTSQIRFPKESVLDYLAYKKTLRSCDGEWLTLHKAVENTIREKEREAKAARRRYVMGDGEYATILLEAVEQKQDENSDDVVAMVERGVQQYDESGKPSDRNIGEIFMDTIAEYINTKIPNEEAAKAAIEQAIPKKKSPNLSNKSFISKTQETVYPQIFQYYKECIERVKCVPISIADSVITLDKKKVGTVGERYSLLNNLLMTKKGNFVHPVAALIRLCQFRKALSEKMEEYAAETEWDELKQRNVSSIPSRFTSITSNISVGKSAYATMGQTRFADVIKNSQRYTSSKTKVLNDFKVLQHDANHILSKINVATSSQISAKVYSAIARDVDLLIAKYRSFFNRFEKEKETLEEQAVDAHRKDAGPIDSVINVYSSEKDKDVISDIVEDGNGIETEADILATDNIVGKGVFDSAYASAVAERADDDSFNDNDSSAYRSLFSSMVKAYRDSIARSEMYKNVASHNAIEAIVASCGENAAPKSVDDALRSALSVAQELAIPSLRLEANVNEADLVTPSHIMVFMLSLNTAKYIKKNAEKFGLHLPADQNNEGSVLKACAEEFIRDYSGNSGARVAIVKSIPDQILYCTGEIMDITPLCIAKFNELGEDSVYFKNYNEALRRFKKYETDMWNPHLGNGLFKRGYLPYMNAEMENACDEKMVKALFYALNNGLIRYADGVGAAAYNNYYFVCGQAKIFDSDNKPINNKNIAQLLSWLRNEDQKIEDWSREFDREINRQMNALPSIVSDNEVGALEAALTNSPFSKMLNELLYKDPTEKSQKLSYTASKKSKKDADTSDSVWVTKLGPTAAEFAYLIKTSEENGRDCDDAERILRVLYKIFVDMISYRISPEVNPERFVTVYKQQLKKFYEAFAGIEVICKAGRDCEAYYRQLVDWMNQAGLFLDISAESPLDEKGQIAINLPFNYENVPTIKALLSRIKNAKKKADAADEAADEAPAVEEEADAATDAE